MMKKSMHICIKLVFIALIITSIVGIASAAKITVDANGGADYISIQEAINAAKSGDTIYVRAGVYFGSLNITKKLTLQGEGEKTIVHGNFADKVISVYADGVELRGFNVTGSKSGGIGIYLKGKNIVLQDNAVISSSIEEDKRSKYGIYYRNNLFGKATDNFGRNAWDNGKEGNYWDDYSGKDANSDGIGDTPYTNINTNSFATDSFPLMNPVKIPADAQTPGIIEGIKEKLFPSKEPKVTPAPAPTQTTPIMPSPTQIPEEQTPAPLPSTSQPPRGIFVPLWLLLTLGGAALVAILFIFRKQIAESVKSVILRYYRAKMKKWEKEGYDVSKLEEVLGDEK